MNSTNAQRARLVENLLSPEVQVHLPADGEEVEAKLSAAEVAKVFTEHVPGVGKFLFRQQPGQYVLKFVQVAYKDGWNAFRGTDLHDHLKWLMRLIVHYGYEGKPGASQYLAEVAEAFMDCQAVQARVVERIGLQIRGVAADFQGLLTALVGEYKTMSLKMLAAERLAQGRASDDATPTHYENRLTEDIGQLIGLNADDVRRAGLDEHARARFAKLRANDAQAAAVRCREMFDLDALLQATVSELNSFSESSVPNSMPRLFLNWVSRNMAEKHLVFDEETCTRVDVDCSLVLAIFEVVFLGELTSADDNYRGASLQEIFVLTSSQPSDVVVEVVDNAILPPSGENQFVEHDILGRPHDVVFNSPLSPCAEDQSFERDIFAVGNSTLPPCSHNQASEQDIIALVRSPYEQIHDGKFDLNSLVGKLAFAPVLVLMQTLSSVLDMLWPSTDVVADA
jgi:hypothetical protein